MYIYVFVNLFGLLFELVSLTFFPAAPVYRIYYAISHTVVVVVVDTASVIYSHMGKLNCVEIQVASSSLVCLLHLSGLILSLYSYFMMCMLLLFILLHNLLINTHTHTPFFRNVSSLSLCRLFVFCEYILCILPINNIYSEFQFQAF